VDYPVLWTTQCTARPGVYDWLCDSCDAGLSSINPVESDIIISLLTWRQETLSDPNDRNLSDTGWWADPNMGSYLWRLPGRAKNSVTLALARAYVEQALQWLVTEKYTTQLLVTAEWDETDPRLLSIIVKMDRNVFMAALSLNSCIQVTKSSCVTVDCR
jgi:phage gp46-like protein